MVAFWTADELIAGLEAAEFADHFGSIDFIRIAFVIKEVFHLQYLHSFANLVSVSPCRNSHLITLDQNFFFAAIVPDRLGLS